MTPTPFTRGRPFTLPFTSAGKVARAARRLTSTADFSSSWAAQLPRLAFVLAGDFRGGKA